MFNRERRDEGPEAEMRDDSGAPAEEQVLPAEELVGEEEEGEAREASETEVLQNELGLLETQLRDMRDRYIRSVADLDNAVGSVRGRRLPMRADRQPRACCSRC